ncbi:hypothetical protein LK994_12960 [Ferruginibacter lapsinanis]|uniref:hypothetical protein n=1 Tax=Ferruginibacter lapsinanis TaxID=563172 RepID=UPI001E593D1E|nr:hypothetical protein [Ferruginibacter lapsinanis]UEG49544.1 hypothetical protein LK994_12960 [Ferruginibacter lapsinanis]
MKKIIQLSFMLLCSCMLHAQVLKFCNAVNSDGTLKGESTSFIIEKGDEICFYVTTNSSASFNTSKLKYKIYTIDLLDGEVYDNTIEQDIKEDWGWAWRGIIFNRADSYKVYVYNGRDELLASGTIKIIF